MVFSDKKMKSSHHNKLNLRDTSVEPTNLFGDHNLPQGDTDRELNDRLGTPVNLEIPDDLPPLEEAHVPHHERKARAAASKDSRKPRSNLR